MSSVGRDIELVGVCRGMLAVPPRTNCGTASGGGEGTRGEERNTGAGLYAGTSNVGNADGAGTSRHRRCGDGEKEAGHQIRSRNELQQLHVCLGPCRT